jgi:hypothetical protein
MSSGSTRESERSPGVDSASGSLGFSGRRLRTGYPVGLPDAFLNVVIARRGIPPALDRDALLRVQDELLRGSSVIPRTQTSPPEPLPTRLRRMRLGLAIQAWLSGRPARRGGAWPLAAVRRATRHSRRRRRPAPSSPMRCSTRTRRSLDGPHRRCSALVAGEHARPIARSRTGSATTRLPPPVEHEAVLDADDPTDRLQPWLPASQIRLIRTTVRMLRVGPGGMRPAEDRAEGPAAGTGVSCQTEGASSVWGSAMFRVGGCEGLLEHVL